MARKRGSRSKPISTQMDKNRDMNRHGGKRKGRRR